MDDASISPPFGTEMVVAHADPFHVSPAAHGGVFGTHTGMDHDAPFQAGAVVMVKLEEHVGGAR